MQYSSELLLQKALIQANTKLQSFFNQKDFTEQLQIAFGNNFENNTALGIASQIQSGDFSLLPEVQILTEGELGHANGAYAASLDRILVSSDFLTQHQNDTSAVAEMLLEEIGHKLDFLLNGSTDSPGDEGAIFRLLATGKTISDQTLAG